MRLSARLILLTVLTLMAAPGYGAENPEKLVSLLVDPLKREGAARELLAMGDRGLAELEKFFSSKTSSDLQKQEIVALLPRFGHSAIRVLARIGKDRRFEVQAVRALGSLDDNEQLASPMATFLSSSNPQVRLAVLQWFEQRAVEVPGFESRLGRLLADSSAATRDLAAAMAARTCPSACLLRVLELYRTESVNPNPDNLLARLGLIRAMGEIGATSQRYGAMLAPILLQALYEKDQERAAVEALISLRESAVSAVLMLLKRGDVQRAPAAMEVLMNIGPAAAPEVVSLLGARHAKLRELALRFLSFYRDPAVLPALTRLYRDGDAFGRLAAIKISALYRDEAAFVIIKTGIREPEMEVRMAALEAAEKSGATELVPLILTCAEEDPEWEVRVKAIEALFRMGEYQAHPVFIRMIQYERWEIRLALLKVLAWMGKLSDVPNLADLLANRRNEVVSSTQDALESLTCYGGKRTIEEWKALAERLVKNTKSGRAVAAKKSFPVEGGAREALFFECEDCRPVMFLKAGAGLEDPALFSFAEGLEKDIRLAIVDFPGCDRERLGKRVELAACLDAEAERVEFLRVKLGLKKMVLAGHSSAAYLAIWYAARYPENVERLVLLDAVYPDQSLVAEAEVKTVQMIPASWKSRLAWLDTQKGQMTSAVYRRYRGRAEVAGLVSNPVLAVKIDSYLPPWALSDQILLEHGYGALEDRLASLRQPVLLAFGDRAPVREKSIERFRVIAKNNHNLVLLKVPGTVQFSWVEDRKRIHLALREFIEGVELPRGMRGLAASTGAEVRISYTGGAEEKPATDAAPAAPAVMTVAGSPMDVLWSGSAKKTPIGVESLSSAMKRDAPVSEAAPEVAEAAPAQADEPAKPAKKAGVSAAPAAAPAVAKASTAKPAEIKKAPTPEQPSAKTQQAGRPRPSSSVAAARTAASGGSGNFWRWLMIGGGSAAVIGGAVLHVMAFGDAGSANDLSPYKANYSARFNSLYDSAKTKEMAAFGAYGVGALLIGGGVAWLVFGGGGSASGVMPALGETGVWGLSTFSTF